MSIFSKLKSALTPSSSRIGEGITAIFTKEKLDDAALEELEELLITADMGVEASAAITAQFSKQKFDKGADIEVIKAALAEEIANVFVPTKPLFDAVHVPQVVVVVGVNGNGKTTTIGKFAHQLKADGKTVLLAAADTFRAAAAEQLEVWANRLSVPLVKGAAESDPAAVAYEAVQRAVNEKIDVVLIDTAGRLHNKANLMDELKKIIRVIQKVDANFPHRVVQVLDATTGGNAVSQVAAFKEMVQVSDLVITKLDGTAKGGVVVALAKKFNLPVAAIGVGEGVEDLQPFNAKAYAHNLVGV